MPKISERGYWIGEGGHLYDPVLAAGIVNILKGLETKTVIDIGCGDGSYTRHLIDNGFKCACYDGNPDTQVITRGLCSVADFSQPQGLGVFDCALSLEVGEHIPAQYADVFIDNLALHSLKTIVMSWAVPGQTGHGHINEMTNEDVISMVELRGFYYDISRSTYLRQNVSSCYWFQDTVMVFKND